MDLSSSFFVILYKEGINVIGFILLQDADERAFNVVSVRM